MTLAGCLWRPVGCPSARVISLTSTLPTRVPAASGADNNGLRTMSPVPAAAGPDAPHAAHAAVISKAPLPAIFFMTHLFAIVGGHRVAPVWKVCAWPPP